MTELIDELPSTQIPFDESQLHQKIAGDHPEMPEAPDNTVQLLRGIYKDGVWHKDVELRELTGVDEEKLSKVKTDAAVFDTILALGVTAVGGIDFSEMTRSEKEAVLSELLIGERMVIYLNIVRVTFGNDKLMNWTCSSCSADNETVILISEDFKLESKDDEEPQVSYEFTTSKGDKLTYRLAVGSDQKAITDNKKNVTVAEANTILLSKILTQINDKFPLDAMEYVRNLSLKDRTKILEDLDKRQPYVDMGLDIDCPSCGEVQRIPLSWGDLFRP
jgi:hypothetical protein